MTIMAREEHEFGTGERLMEKVHQRSSQRVNSPIFRTRRDTQKGDERALVVGWTHPEMLYAGALWTHWQSVRRRRSWLCDRLVSGGIGTSQSALS